MIYKNDKFISHGNINKIGDTAFELVLDPNTGAQVLKMVTKQKVGQESFEDILRLASKCK